MPLDIRAAEDSIQTHWSATSLYAQDAITQLYFYKANTSLPYKCSISIVFNV